MSNAFLLGTLVSLLSMPLSFAAIADDGRNHSLDESAEVRAIRAKIASNVPPAKLEDVRSVAGGALYEITLNNRHLYATADGKFMVAGDLFDLESRSNLTESRRADARKAALRGVVDSDAIVFAPNGPAKYSITVFTDPDCTYCRKLHSEIAAINQLGIRVRYVAFPRTGPGTESWLKTEAIWCSKDRRQALTDAKLGENVTAPKCESPVAKQFHIGEQMGARGTPMILSEGATVVGGYLPPDQLIARLDELKKQEIDSMKAKSK